MTRMDVDFKTPPMDVLLVLVLEGMVAFSVLCSGFATVTECRILSAPLESSLQLGRETLPTTIVVDLVHLLRLTIVVISEVV